jgi:hypothetical protein
LHRAAARRLQGGYGGCRIAPAALWFSRQVLRDYLAVVTRPQATEPALSGDMAAADARGFLARLHVAEDGPHVICAI